MLHSISACWPSRWLSHQSIDRDRYTQHSLRSHLNSSFFFLQMNVLLRLMILSWVSGWSMDYYFCVFQWFAAMWIPFLHDNYVLVPAVVVILHDNQPFFSMIIVCLKAVLLVLHDKCVSETCWFCMIILCLVLSWILLQVSLYLFSLVKVAHLAENYFLAWSKFQSSYWGTNLIIVVTLLNIQIKQTIVSRGTKSIASKMDGSSSRPIKSVPILMWMHQLL